MTGAIRYLVASKGGGLPDGCRLIADGEMISFEQPWTFGAPRILRIDGTADFDVLKAKMAADGCNGFAVEGLEEPGDGQAFALGGHIMQDMERFKPYAAAVPEVVKSFGGRFLARAGAVTLLSGAFIPERVVLIEFPTAHDALAFYISDRYAPLLKLRLATTQARFVIAARSGDLPVGMRAAAEGYLRQNG
jgi:uncharacterized protein (DUF1330 family)